ncbi:proteolipid membrane potential modulator domain-containing protein [Ditylenchus destructor]|uniref:Proteolipid membrane potential modulator domain-containing protein n=1 Tax=Ditylenchus destructor TaxID=166010 RepID=A0AAD4N7Q0_9BILA|nr:proteolipid membrane potential modulator domain-containing protein [Ditylenchus destructor]
MAITAQQVIEAILCLLLPPVAIFFHANDCNIHVLINILLCLIVWVPAILHAIWFCFFRGGYVATPVQNA